MNAVLMWIQSLIICLLWLLVLWLKQYLPAGNSGALWFCSVCVFLPIACRKLTDPALPDSSDKKTTTTNIMNMSGVSMCSTMCKFILKTEGVLYRFLCVYGMCVLLCMIDTLISGVMNNWPVVYLPYSAVRERSSGSDRWKDALHKDQKRSRNHFIVGRRLVNLEKPSWITEALCLLRRRRTSIISIYHHLLCSHTLTLSDKQTCTQPTSQSSHLTLPLAISVGMSSDISRHGLIF